jgi:aminoglycoside phosphotransferase family enzyme/predicted kinase
MIATLEDHALLTQALQQQLGATRYETHISTVLVAQGSAWKIKKPLDLGFLDFSTLEKRRFCCEEEVRLNARLAADIYRRVIAIGGTAQAPLLDASSAPIEYAVEMREFPAEALLADHPELLDAKAMSDIAQQIAQFQRDISRAPVDGEYGTVSAVLAPMQQNFDQLAQLVTDAEDLTRLTQLNQWTVQRHTELSALLATRLKQGFVGEGHGDMHLGNIAVEQGRFIIFDGIEFNPNLRWIDNINEIAFLMMDLDRNGRADLSGLFLNAWLHHSGDYAGLALVRFYQVYRAMVRTKIAAFRLAQDLSAAEHAAVTQAYREYLALAERYSLTQQPRLLVTVGPSGSGKSVAARQIIAQQFAQMPAVQISSDIERKRLAGLDPLADSKSAPGAGIYTADMSARTYARLLELSAMVVQAGFTAIADATFLQQAHRQPFLALAERLQVPVRLLVFTVAAEELAQRVAQRLQRGDDPAEANETVLAAQLRNAEPLTDAEAIYALPITSSELLSGDFMQALL